MWGRLGSVYVSAGTHNVKFELDARTQSQDNVVPSPSLAGCPEVVDNLKRLSESWKHLLNYLRGLNLPRHEFYRDIWLTARRNRLVSSNFPGRIQLTCFIFLSILVSRVSAATDLTKCMVDIQNGLWKSDDGKTYGVTDDFGNPAANASEATGITYELCVRACGSGAEAFRWTSFSEQFNSWLLPWLAMLSLLHFGREAEINVLSVFLTVGSPTLAVYSLALAVLGRHWLVRSFLGTIAHARQHPDVIHAIHALRCLQQTHLNQDRLLASLRTNESRWRELRNKLDYANTWSLATATSIVWVIVAYLLTVIGSFSAFNEVSTRIEIASRVGLVGQGISSVWLWLLPVAVGWLYLSPKCDSVRINDAIDAINAQNNISTTDVSSTPEGSGNTMRDPNIEAAERSTPDRPIEMGVLQGTPRSDIAEEHTPLMQPEPESQVLSVCRPPIFTYACFLSWVREVEDVREAFQYSHGRVQEEYQQHAGARLGAPLMIFAASLLALFLQWSTAVAGMIFALFTPTRGLGCRSGSYLIYASASTLVWMVLLVSSLLAPLSTRNRRSLAGWASVALRRFGYLIAFLNFCWIIVVCLLQCGNFFSRCFCSSSYYGLHSRAFVELVFTAHDIAKMKSAWIGAAALAGGSSVAFFVFLFIYGIDPPPPFLSM